jgi:hypothetical protein
MRNLSLARRIARLEVQCARPVHREPLVMLVDFAGPNSKLDGKVVLDLFRNSGSVCWAKERLAVHPEDTGNRCEPGGYLPDVLLEIHESCPWHQEPGGCRLCEGTPIADAAKTIVLEK